MPSTKIGNLGFPGGFLNYLYIPKSVVIYNPKLGFILLLLRLFVIVFLLAEYLTDLNWTYASTIPEGFVSYWASPNWEYYRHTVKAEAQAEMCKNAAEYAYTAGERVFNPSGCIDLLPGDTWIKGDSSMFVPTYLDDTWIEQTSGEGDCLKLKSCCGTASQGDLGGGYFCANHGFRDGVFNVLEEKNSLGDVQCRCERHASYFVRGADGLKVTLHPSFVVALPHGREAGTTTDISKNILTMVKLPSVEENRGGDSTSSQGMFGGLEEMRGDSFLEVSTPPEFRTPKEDLEDRASKVMRKPRKDGSSAWSKAGSLSVDNFKEAGMTVFQALEVGSGVLQRETNQFYEDVADSGDRLMRRDHESAGETDGERLGEQEGFSSSSESWMSYFQRKLFQPVQSINATLIQPGEIVEMSLEKWLEHATMVEGQKGHPKPISVISDDHGEFLLDTENEGVHANEHAKGRKFPTFRVTGVELTFDLQWRNPLAHGFSEHNSTILEIEVLARGGWHTQPQAYHIEPQDPVTGRAKMVLRQFSGVSIRFQSSGRFCYFSFVAVATAVSAMIVYIGLPAVIINAFAMNVLGHASSYYWLAANQVLDTKDMLLGMCARAVAMHQATKDEDLSVEEVKRSLKTVFKVSSELENEEFESNMDHLAELLIQTYGNKKSSLLGAKQLVDTALSDEPIHMDDAAPMYCTDSQRANAFLRLMEYLFVSKDARLRPGLLGKELTIVLTKVSPDDELGVDVKYSATTSIIVTAVTGGLVQQWNEANPSKQVQCGDKFVKVNGKTDDVHAMMEECKTAIVVKITLIKVGSQKDVKDPDEDA